MQLGTYTFENPVILAPMAGVSDRVFRSICRAHGADYAPSEMTAAALALRDSIQTRRRLDLSDERSPRIVQIAGAVPAEMAQAAQAALENGAEVIDINMGCPAKRVCNRLAGSALLKDETLVAQILAAVVGAVSVPVTLKTRTGWDPAHRNAVRVAQLAESLGIKALTLHGRTRTCAYQGEAEYDTIAAVKAAVSIPVIANGDITSGAKACSVLRHTGADGLMIGRAAQGNPWIFAAIKQFMAHGTELASPSHAEVCRTLRDHISGLHTFYGEALGVRIARKHAGWYFMRWMTYGASLRAQFNSLEKATQQLAFIDNYNDQTPIYGEAA